MYSEKATKFWGNLPLTFDYSTYSQKVVEDFAKFCGLLRIYKLYLSQEHLLVLDLRRTTFQQCDRKL